MDHTFSDYVKINSESVKVIQLAHLCFSHYLRFLITLHLTFLVKVISLHRHTFTTSTATTKCCHLVMKYMYM